MSEPKQAKKVKNFDDTTADEIVQVFLSGAYRLENNEWQILPTSGVLWLWCDKFKEKKESPLSLSFEYNENGEITYLQFGSDGRKFNQLKAFNELMKLGLSFAVIE